MSGDEFAARVEAAWEELGRPGPGRSSARWFAELVDVTAQSVYYWRDGTVPVPDYAIEALEKVRAALLRKRTPLERTFGTRQETLRGTERIRAEARENGGTG